MSTSVTTADYDIVFVRGLRVDTIIGIYEWEKLVKQTLFIDLTLYTTIIPAASSDNINDAIDYKQLTNSVIDFAEQHHFNLVETLAERLAALILTTAHVAGVQLTINKKGALRMADDVGISITRMRS